MLQFFVGFILGAIISLFLYACIIAGAEYDRHKMMQEAIDKLDITLEASGLVPEGKEKEN